MPQHQALSKGGVAVITGGASGIGLAAARRFAAFGMKLVLANLSQDALDRAPAQLSDAELVAVPTDVGKIDEVHQLKDRAYAAFGAVDVLIDDTGASPGGGPFDHYERWQRVLAGEDLWGVINEVHAFTQAMIDQKRPGAIVNTGSKQGITCPPGDTAYNITKAGVKVLTEGLAHSLRNMRGLPGHCALAGPGLDLHWHDRARPDREAAPLVNQGPGNRCAGRADGEGRFLHYLPGQRRHHRRRQ